MNEGCVVLFFYMGCVDLKMKGGVSVVEEKKDVVFKGKKDMVINVFV